MRKTPLLILFGAAAAGVIAYLAGGSDDAGTVDVAELARRQAQREAQRQAEEYEQKTNLAVLAEKGLGQELPGHLFSEINTGNNFWFVGKQGSEVGVEIPFEPGKLPLAPVQAEPVNQNPGFLGADACASCHQDKYDSFVQTAHYRTSRRATLESVSGSFESGANEMRTSDPDVHFEMVRRGDDLFQRASFFDWQFEVPLQLIMGSSKMAETYLYWHGDALYQHNCTYFTEPDRWMNSPGFIDGDAAYARPIRPGCLECHVTYADLRKYPNHFTPESLILGISCERCHGPGREHVQFHLANPDEKVARHTSVPSDLSREAQMDVCGQCHTGGKQLIHEAGFQFRPGDSLEDHFVPIEDHDTAPNSVHASDQIDRLAMSECFKQTQMACVECHDPHRNERGQVAVFSRRCLECHQEQHCGMSEQLGGKIAENCIDCHMPRRATANLRVETTQGSVFPPLRDHYIRVDQQATDEYLNAARRD